MLQIPDRKRYIAWESLATAGATIIGAGANMAGQANLNKKNREFAKEEADVQRTWSEEMYNKQNAWNYEMWQAENAYNSPTAQVERLREAGLNPMFYGLDGTGNAGDLSAAQPLGYQRAEATGQVNPFAGADDIALRVAQIANIQADTAKKENENLTETQRREKLIADIANAKQENNNLLAQEGLTMAQREQIVKNNAYLDRLNEATLAEKEADAKLKESQKKRIDELLEGEKVLQAKTAEDFDRKWQKIRAEIGKMSAETGILAKDLENYALNHANNGFMGTGLSLNNLFRLRMSGKPIEGAPNYTDENTDPMDLARSGQ